MCRKLSAHHPSSKKALATAEETEGRETAGQHRPASHSLPRGEARCAVPECRGISHADATFREALWDRFFTAAPRPRTPSELLYSDRRLRSKSSPAATILIRKR